MLIFSVRYIFEFLATARQDFDEVLRLLQNEHLDPNMSNDDGLTAIHQCAIDDSEELLRLLIEFGGDVNARDRDRWTPLHAAGKTKTIEILMVSFIYFSFISDLWSS